MNDKWNEFTVCTPLNTRQNYSMQIVKKFQIGKKIIRGCDQNGIYINVAVILDVNNG